MAQTISAPDGMTGLVVEAWGDTYAVAADWAQASASVYCWAHDEWVLDSHGRQVADFRHSSHAALRAILRECVEDSGDEPDEHDLAELVADAEALPTRALMRMIDVLEGFGDRFAGSDVVNTAQDWLDQDFDAAAADAWCEIGVWDPGTAARFRDADLTPAQVKEATDSLVEDMDDDERDEAFTDGDPIYSVCNGDTDADEIIAAARGR